MNAAAAAAVTDTSTRPPLRLVARMCLLGAVLWSAALLVLGFTAPVYGEASSSSDARGATVTRTLTLVEANGASAVVVLLVPLVVSAVVAALLWTGRARPLAWTLAAALTVATVLALMSIGLFVLPVCVALLVACASARASAYWDTGLGAPAR